MSARMSRMLLAAACCCVLLIVIAVGVKSGSTKPNDNRPMNDNTVVELAVAGTGCNKGDVVSLAMLGQGFKSEEFVMGDQIDWSAPEANSRGSAAFDTSTPTTAQALVDKLAATDDKSVAALNALLLQSGAPREQLLDPGNWTAVQWLVPVDMPGNTAYRDGASVSAGTRHSKVGDVGWYFVKPDKCRQVTDGSIPPHDAIVLVRAGCKNLQTAPVVPARPSQPASAPVTTTPNRPTTPTTTCPSTICKGPASSAPPGDPGSGGSPGNGGAENPGNTGYTPTDPPPTPRVPPAPTPTSIVTLPPTTTPITPITAPPG